jgi:hypothetical protein
MRCPSVAFGMANRMQSSSAVGYAKFRSRSHDAVIRVYDEAGNSVPAMRVSNEHHSPVFKAWRVYARIASHGKD